MNLILIFGIVISIYFLVSIIELIGLHRFNLKFYNHGFKILEKTIKYKCLDWKSLNEIYTEEVGEYVFIADMKVGYFVTNVNFYSTYRLFTFFRFIYYRGTPITIFGKITDENSEIIISFYISYRLVFVVVLWLLAIIATSVYITVLTWTFDGLIMGVIGLILSLGIWYIAKLYYRFKTARMIDEIVNILRIENEITK